MGGNHTERYAAERIIQRLQILQIQALTYRAHMRTGQIDTCHVNMIQTHAHT